MTPRKIADIIYNAYILEGWKNVSMKDCTKQAVCYLETKPKERNERANKKN